MDKFGIQEGPKIGEILDNVHHAQMEEHIKTKEEAIEFVKNYLGNKL